MGERVVIRLAGEPEGKGRPRFNRQTGRAYTPAATQKYESALRYVAQDAMGERKPLEGPLKVVVVACLPIPASWSKKKQREAQMRILRPTGRPDVDNLVKMIDACNDIVWRDDSQIVDCLVRKFYSDTPELVITVESAPVPLLEARKDVGAPQPELALELSP
jgi:Holliday junction resolvase RusA-like endonuclease